ncbi:UDP-N-acetylglucosamine 1-carboxyvinyltransferase [Candidatus Bipolaricaulota bacterium]|nr:UDP-N-acetylglucosamine 1-carboxyvinyltransferase [Candidatus Bipolaricaulota bacterium]
MTEQLLIRGGKPLEGRIKVPGAKNSALPLLAASLLTDDPVVLKNVPPLKDVGTMLSMIRELGKNIETTDQRTVRITGGIAKNSAPEELVRRMRASFLVLSPLLGRVREAVVPLPGGCNIGTRPVDLHLNGLSRLGTEIGQADGKIIARAKKLRGNEIFLDYPSVGTTEQLLMAAVGAEGETVIFNGAQEPEVRDLVNFLVELGADIEVDGSILTVRGADELHGGEYEVLPDRIAGGTYMIAIAATGGHATVDEVRPSTLKQLTLKMRKSGITVNEGVNSVEVIGDNRPKNLEVRTLPYPGFPTDLQAPISALLTIAEGKSVVKETVFDSRFGHVAELRKMGADISVPNSSTLFINGTDGLRGAKVEATDIRAGASLVIAGLASSGTTEVSGLEHIDRGYSQLVENFQDLNAELERSKIDE